MPKKKAVKKTVKKATAKAKPIKKIKKVDSKPKVVFKKEALREFAPIAEVKKSKLNLKNLNFMLVLLLFCGVSLYAVSSFFFSTNNYLKSMYTSVVGEMEKDETAIPDSCKPCTDAPECEAFCKVEPYEIFRDVRSDDEIAIPLEELKDVGIIKGYDDGTFKPNDKITRAESLVILTNAIDADFSGGTYMNCFNDVQDQWFSAYVCYAKEKGFITGYEDATYQPNSYLKKVEAVKMLLTAFEYDIPTVLEFAPFDDAPVDAWYSPYAYVAKQNGIIKEGIYFDPSYELTRADYAHFVYNVMKRKGLIY